MDRHNNSVGLGAFDRNTFYDCYGDNCITLTKIPIWIEDINTGISNGDYKYIRINPSAPDDPTLDELVSTKVLPGTSRD